jgi:hypothetical protein
MPHSNVLLKQRDQPIQPVIGARLRFGQSRDALSRCLDESTLRVSKSLYLSVGAILPRRDVREAGFVSGLASLKAGLTLY